MDWRARAEERRKRRMLNDYAWHCIQDMTMADIARCSLCWDSVVICRCKICSVCQSKSLWSLTCNGCDSCILCCECRCADCVPTPMRSFDYNSEYCQKLNKVWFQERRGKCISATAILRNLVLRLYPNLALLGPDVLPLICAFLIPLQSAELVEGRVHGTVVDVNWCHHPKAYDTKSGGSSRSCCELRMVWGRDHKAGWGFVQESLCLVLSSWAHPPDVQRHLNYYSDALLENGRLITKRMSKEKRKRK